MTEDIVERLQRLVRDGAVEPRTARDYSDAAAEIERLRGELDGLAEFAADALTVSEEDLRGGWTRLGPGHLPPQDGQVFELHFQDLKFVFVGAWYKHRHAYNGVRFIPDGLASLWEWHADELSRCTGWWRLLPGGEPPT